MMGSGVRPSGKLQCLCFRLRIYLSTLRTAIATLTATDQPVHTSRNRSTGPCVNLVIKKWETRMDSPKLWIICN